jgi:hypothetical protein
MLDLEPIKARLAAATPGPWHVEPISYPERALPEVYAGTSRVAQPCNSREVPAPESDFNAEFIGYAPVDIAALVEEIEQLRMALDTVGATIYTQGRGTKVEQGLLSFIRKSLGRE